MPKHVLTHASLRMCLQEQDCNIHILHPHRWTVSGQPGLYSVGGGFNRDTGRFTAPKRAVYYCYAQIRVDGASSEKGGYFRLLLALNGQLDTHNGFGAIGGNHESTNYRSMGVAGTIYMQSGNYMTINTYSNKDASYKVQTESGWGCHEMNSRYGFHANAKEDQRLGRGWTRLVTNICFACLRTEDAKGWGVIDSEGICKGTLELLDRTHREHRNIQAQPLTCAVFVMTVVV